MLPVIALVGRPNVGKSTLFNCLTKTRAALVADSPGLTRDRQYGLGLIGSRPYLVIDTGGLTQPAQALTTSHNNRSTLEIDQLVTQQALQAIAEADIILLLVDGRAGLTAADQTIVDRLRRTAKPIYLVVNKTEQLDLALATAEFYQLGLAEIIAISAAHKRGIGRLIDTVLADPALSAGDAPSPSLLDETEQRIRIAIVGRPNVGKSTLVNRLLGEPRVLAFDRPGTTRDSIAIPFDKHGKRYTLIDTAGVRRRSRVNEVIEKFSVIKTLQAIEQAHVVILLLDARQGVSEQDATLLGYILDRGRALVLAVNKWDKLSEDVRAHTRRELNRRLAFVDFAEFHFISALHGSGVSDLVQAVDRAYAAATRKLSTPSLNQVLENALHAHQPPLVHGHSIKLRYAHQGGQTPPVIVIHGTRTDRIPDSYRRYLANTFRKQLNLHGTPVRIEFKNTANPYLAKKATRKRPSNKSRRRKTSYS